MRLFLWRYRKVLALAWLAVLSAAGYGVWWYLVRMPGGLDTGLAVAARSLAYQKTFREVERARRDLDRGRLEAAEVRLELFLGRHADVQPAQLHTHAVTDAAELLAELYRSQGRYGRARRIAEAMAERTPLNYRVWQILAQIRSDSGDPEGAAAAYREAFKLALNHPEVAEGYLEVLAELNAFEDIAWVADQFQRAARRGAPSVTMKVGVARDPLQRRLLSFCGVPVEQANYFRAVDLYQLPRGEDCRVAAPPEFLEDWSFAAGPMYIQLRFEGVYEDLAIETLRYWTRSGEEREYPLDETRVSYLHRPHSGVEFYAEIRTDLEASGVSRFEIGYRCPEHALTGDALAIVDKARANLAARGGP